MSHVTLLELHQFVSRAERSAEFDAHVSTCASCAERLSALSRRAVAPLSVSTSVDDEPRRLAMVVMAFAACVAVMAVQSLHLPKLELPAYAPEGVHGVSRLDAPSFLPSGGFEADSGVADSGLR